MGPVSCRLLLLVLAGLVAGCDGGTDAPPTGATASAHAREPAAASGPPLAADRASQSGDRYDDTDVRATRVGGGLDPDDLLQAPEPRRGDDRPRFVPPADADEVIQSGIDRARERSDGVPEPAARRTRPRPVIDESVRPRSARPRIARAIESTRGAVLRGPRCEFARRRMNARGCRGDENVGLALKWLHDHQGADGSWDPQHFDRAGAVHGRTRGQYGNRDGSDDTGWASSRVGITALAVLAFLAANHSHTAGEFADTVKRGLRWLKSAQDNDGAFDTTCREDPYFVYGHAIATTAMAEACGMTGSCLLRGPAQKGVDFIARAQNHDRDRGHLGWRYGVQPGDSDTSVTGWMMMACTSARTAGLDVPAHVFAGGLRHLDDMTGTFNGYPKTGYLVRAGVHHRCWPAATRFAEQPTMSAVHIVTRVFAAGWPRDRERQRILRGLADVIRADDHLPTLDDPDQRDYVYWYQASLAMFQLGDHWWRDWEGPMGDALIGSQRLDARDPSDRVYGSWDSDDAWGVAGGRVYATAINCLTLTVYYRYRRHR